MEKLEQFIPRVLFILFVVILLNTVTRTILVTQDFINLMLIGFITSGMLSFIFPLWKVGRKLGTQNIQQIMSYRRNYKIRYVAIAFGFWGLLVLNTTPNDLEHTGIVLAFKLYGLVFVCTCLVVLIISGFFSKIKESKENGDAQ